MSEKLEINIIYAEEDNKPILQDRGWVSYFEKFLYMMLKQTMNRKIQINLISDTAAKEIQTHGLFIPILSPDFILSGACLDRIENLFLENKSDAIHDQIFPIFKSPLSYLDIPEKLRVLRSYIFYLDHEDQEKELSEFFSKEAEKGYWMKMVDLCFDIYETILNMNPKNKLDKSHDRKTIYLAETGQDLAGARSIIKRELTRHGYEVYPKTLLPHTISEVNKSIEEDLKKCQFSIHMIGASYGTIPNGTESSITDIQNTLASEYAEANPQTFNRLIWISLSLKYASEKQKAFIHNIKRDDKASYGAEVLQTSLEDFKNTLWEELLDKGLNKKLRNSISHEMQYRPIIYLMYDELDSNEVEPIKNEILKHDVDIVTLDTNGELMDLRNNHIDALKRMDAAIVFQENVNHQWVYMKLLDLLKAPGFGRSKPILGKLFKSKNPKDSEDEFVSRYEVRVDSGEDFKKLNIFISDIKLAFDKSQSKIAEQS